MPLNAVISSLAAARPALPLTFFPRLFSGICYVYEVMREKISHSPAGFLLAGSFGGISVLHIDFRSWRHAAH